MFFSTRGIKRSDFWIWVDLLYQVTVTDSGRSRLVDNASSARSPTLMRMSWRGCVTFIFEGDGDCVSCTWTRDEDVTLPMQFVASQV